MPPDSAFRRRGGNWTTDHELAALAVEKFEARLSTLTAMWASDQSKRLVEPPVTLTHPDRPKPEPAPKRKVRASELGRLIGGG